MLKHKRYKINDLRKEANYSLVGHSDYQVGHSDSDTADSHS